MPASPISASLSPTVPRRQAMMEKALDLEGLFLSEMLGQAGLGSMKGPFNGGIGEEQFASFLRNAQARAIVDQGGIGLSEALFNAMARAERNDR